MLLAWWQAGALGPWAPGLAVGAEGGVEKLRLVPVVYLRRSPLLQPYLDGHRCISTDAKVFFYI